jgi:uncharacterized protein (TIGR02594 family)
MGRRRQFLIGGLCAGITAGWAPVVFCKASQEKESSDYYSAYIPKLRPLGTKEPEEKEVAKGDQLVLGSPKGASLLETMEYFAAIKDVNVDGELYNAGWSSRWNPVVVRFFECGGMKPSGDETHWCAACLNWVLWRSGFVGTCSSSSSSFRCVGSETRDPAPGDIVVFKHKNEDLARAGRGHVGLFVSKTGAAMKVLGGNQVRAGHHAVCVQTIDDRVPLVFHSFRAVNSLVRLTDASQPCPCKPAVNRYCPPSGRFK